MLQANNTTNSVKDEPMDAGAPDQLAENMPPIVNSPAPRRGAHPGATRDSSGRGRIPRGRATRGRGNSGGSPARAGAATRGGITKGKRGGAVNLAARNAAPHTGDAFSRAAGLATPSPGPVTPSASASTSVEPVKKTRKQRSRTVAAPEAKPFDVSSEQERRFTGGDLSLLESGAFADALIVSKEITWKVHKTILCPRSEWFRCAFGTPTEDGRLPVVNLHNLKVEDIDVMLRFIYSGSLDMTHYALASGSFLKYTRLFETATTFQLPDLMNDAMTLLGQFCDLKLQSLCSYSLPHSGRHGVLDPADSPAPWLPDLLAAIALAFADPDVQTDLQLLLASFCYGGRTRLFPAPAFQALAETCPAFGNTIFKLMLPGTVDTFAPEPICNTAAGVDHTHRSQHPDRCAHCDRTFGEGWGSRKAMWNPWEANVRASTYCAGCVEGNEGGAPLWRMEGGMCARE